MATEKRLIEIPDDGIIRIPIMQGDISVGERRIDLSHLPTVDAVEVPCRMGDEVWGLKDYYGRKIPKLGVVNQIYFGEDMRLCICVKNVCRGEWGKNVFATKEETEAAIERRTDNA